MHLAICVSVVLFKVVGLDEEVVASAEVVDTLPIYT